MATNSNDRERDELVSFIMRYDRPGKPGGMMELYLPSGDEPPGTSSRGFWFMRWFVRRAAKRDKLPLLLRVTIEDITDYPDEPKEGV